MELKVEVPKESYELAQAVVAVVKSVKDALADGFQPGQDLPAVVIAAFGQLSGAVQGLDKLDDELKASPVGVAKALGLSIGDAIEALLKKPAA